MSAEYPKWVKVHESYIEMQGDNKIVQLFHEFFVDRNTKEVTVLVKDADEEKLATSEKPPTLTEKLGIDTKQIIVGKPQPKLED